MYMKEKIKTLEAEARNLEPAPAERKKFFKQVGAYSQHYLNALDEAKAYEDSDTRGEGLLDHPISEEGSDLNVLLHMIDQHLDRNGIRASSGGHLGYVPGGGVYPSSLADYIADVANYYAGVFFASPGAVRMENMMIRWMCELVGFDPEKAGGNLTSGGSIANLIGVVTARDHAGLPARDYHKAVIYMTRHTHHCIDKSIKITGLGDAQIRLIDMDERYRMKPEALRQQLEADKKDDLIPLLIVASAGTTNVGAVDPLPEIGEIAGEYEVWFHVDAAYGGFFLLSEEGRKVIRGLDKADSVIIDPHKGLFIPYGSGAVLVKDKNTLFRSQHYTADYMQDVLTADEELSPSDLSPELTKHFRGLRMWLPLQLLGLKPFRAALSEKIWLTRYFYEHIQQIDGIEVGPPPELSITFFRYVPEDVENEADIDEFNEHLMKEIHRDGRVFMSSTKIDGKFYIRAAILSFRTHLETIQQALNIIREKIALLQHEQV